MCRLATRSPSKKARSGDDEIPSSQRCLWTSKKPWAIMTCLIFAGVSHWLWYLHYSVNFGPPSSILFDILGGVDVASVAIRAVLRIQTQKPPNMPSNGNALWYNREAVNWVREYLPIGNGYLGGKFFCSRLTFLFDKMASFGSNGIRRCDFRPIITHYRFYVEWGTISK